jgi:hypothetical protein
MDRLGVGEASYQIRKAGRHDAKQISHALAFRTTSHGNGPRTTQT